MRFIGITGGVGAGKSEIINYIKEHYPCEVYLADEVAHLVKEKGTKCYEELIALLGDGILDAQGEIHKAKMAEVIFADEALLAQVNEIIHPEVKRYIMNRYEAAKQRGDVKYFFVEAALLIEAGYVNLVDELWYIYASEEVRRQRLKDSRGYSEEKISDILGNQLSEDEFRLHCDYVITNNGTKEEAFRQVDERLTRDGV